MGYVEMKTKDRMITIPDFMVMLRALRKGKRTLTDIHCESTVTYSHIFNLKNVLLNKEWITEKKKGRTNELELTEDGKVIADAVDAIMKVINKEEVVEQVKEELPLPPQEFEKKVEEPKMDFMNIVEEKVEDDKPIIIKNEEVDELDDKKTAELEKAIFNNDYGVKNAKR